MCVCSALNSLYHSGTSVSQYYKVCRDDDIYDNIVPFIASVQIVHCVLCESFIQTAFSRFKHWCMTRIRANSNYTLLFKNMLLLEPVLRIRDILVRILIRGSVPLTNGSGSCNFRQRPSRWLITF
jgi:hypothetical protein